MNAPQALPQPKPAVEARWEARLSKAQRAALRQLYGSSPLTMRELYRPGIDIALTRLIGLGFAGFMQGSARRGIPAAYYITADGRKRAEMTRPRLP